MTIEDRPRVLVLGGGYAGLTAAARLGESATGSVTLVDLKDEFVERIRLHEVAAGATPRALPYAPFLALRGVGFEQAKIAILDPAARLVTIDRPDGTRAALGYDVLVYALGSRTDPGAVPGAAQYAHRLDTLAEARAICRRLAAGPRGTRIVIAGGGLTAIEAAAEVAERWPDHAVTIAVGETFGPASTPGALSPAAIAHVEACFARLGVRIVRARITRLAPDAATITTGESLPFDLAVWAAGFGVPSLAREAGIAVNARGLVVTDHALRSVSHPDIIAIGDAAEVRTEPGGPARMSCAVGRPMGAHGATTVGAVATGAIPAPFAFGYSFRCVSLGRADGLIQFVDETDRPLDSVWTGARGARWKEYVCRRTLNGIGLDPELGPPPDTPPPRPERRPA
ncbi:MAG: oxidoreductase [Alphaproteobacteria bacterium]|nr:oxidoreductase [Alphaproteobacteria bacterium]